MRTAAPRQFGEKFRSERKSRAPVFGRRRVCARRSRKCVRKTGKLGTAPAVQRPRGVQSEDTMVNKVRVNIAGAPYAIATTDSEKYIASLAKRLDEDITKLLDTNENL